MQQGLHAAGINHGRHFLFQKAYDHQISKADTSSGVDSRLIKQVLATSSLRSRDFGKFYNFFAAVTTKVIEFGQQDHKEAPIWLILRLLMTS